MKNNSLNFKILSGVVIGCISISAMGMLIYFNILKIKEHQQKMINAEIKILSVKKLQSQIIDMESGIRGYLLGGRSEDLEPFSRTEGLFDIQLKDTKNLLKAEKAQLQQLDEILEIKGKWIESAAVGEMLSRRKLQAGMITFNQFSESFINSEGNKLIHNLKTKVDSIVELFDIRIIKMKNNISHLMEQILFIVLLGTIATIFVSFIVQFLILKSINKKFIAITENLSNSSVKLKTSGKESRQESLSLKDQCSNLNSGLESNASTLEEIGAMVKRTSDSAEDSVKLVESSQRNSVEGRKLLSSIEVSFKEITTSNSKIEETISGKLEQINKSLEAIDRIAEKTKLINDIVFQTKLLSFNASVEAARAGEHGKGFAVVAEEIGNLAKVSGDSAVKIESIIKEAKVELDGIIKESLDITSDLFDNNKNKLSTGSKFVEECSIKFEEVLKSIKFVGDSFGEINVATEEQATGVREISQSASNFELTSKNCLSIAGKSLDNVEILENEISTLNHEINSIKKTIFGEASKKNLSFRFWKKRVPNKEKSELDTPKSDMKIAS